jgi:hypothetical protein
MNRLQKRNLTHYIGASSGGGPFGNQTWVESIARRFGLESTLRPRGRLQVRNLPVPDFVCYGQIVVELKAVKDIAPEHKVQVINYLKATGMKLGVLVNFGAYLLWRIPKSNHHPTSTLILLNHERHENHEKDTQ